MYMYGYENSVHLNTKLVLAFLCSSLAHLYQRTDSPVTTHIHVHVMINKTYLQKRLIVEAKMVLLF